MKVFAIAVCAVAIFGSLEALPRDEKDIADEIKDVIIKIWDHIPKEIGIKDWNISLPSNLLFGGEFSINDISISGMKALDIKTLKFDKDSSHLDYEFNFGDIAGAIDYSFAIKGLFKIQHHFSFHSDFKDLTTKGHAVIAAVEGHPKKITDFSILVTLGESDFDIKGFLNNDKLSKEMSDILTKNGAAIFDAITPIMSPFFSSIIKTAINIALNILG